MLALFMDGHAVYESPSLCVINGVSVDIRYGLNIMDVTQVVYKIRCEVLHSQDGKNVDVFLLGCNPE